MMLPHFFYKLDWVLILSALTLVFLGLTVMKSFNDLSFGNYFFERQMIWLIIGLSAFFIAALIDWSFLKTNSIFLLMIYLILLIILVGLLVSGRLTRGAASWLNIGTVNVEPVELVKPVLVLILAKYFAKRHIEIGRFWHLFISSFYAGIPMLLVMLQPDFGSAVVLGAIWLGVALVSGIKLRHLFFLFTAGLIATAVLWNFFLLPYQQSRMLSFISPESDIRGAGYHALQSTIAIGSGEIFGKGLGYGTQSRLAFLPEHTTDFIFLPFAEVWGFAGVLILFIFFGMVIWRILRAGIYGESNFEKLYAAGLAMLLFFQASIHIGMNSGMLPITGLGMPFLSYGGSSLISIFFALGILESFSIHKKGIFIGTEERYKEGILEA